MIKYNYGGYKCLGWSMGLHMSELCNKNFVIKLIINISHYHSSLIKNINIIFKMALSSW